MSHLLEEQKPLSSPGPGRDYYSEVMGHHPGPGRDYYGEVMGPGLWNYSGIGPSRIPQSPHEPGVFDEFGAAFHHSLIQSNPEMYGAALEAAGVSSGSESLRAAGERLQRWAAGLEAGRPPVTFDEAEGFGENLRALSGLFGSALGSTVPPLVAGAGGALVGSAVGGPPGALVGGFMAAAAAAAPLNLGEAYRQFKQEGVDTETAAKFGIAIAVPITALDAGGLSRIVSRSLGAPVKKTVLRTIGRRIAEGSLIEGSTEALQSAIREATAAALTDNPDVSRRAWSTFEETLAGVMVGGGIGGVATTADQLLRPPDTAAPPAPPPDSGRPGAAETAATTGAQPLSESDLASPLPDDLIAEGRQFMAMAEGATVANRILAEYGLPNAGEQAIYQSEIVSEDGTVRPSAPERVMVLDAVPSEEYLPGESTPPAVKIWRDGTTFELELPLSGETLTAPPTAQQQADEADRTRFEAGVVETLRPLDTPELRNAALRAELDAEGAGSLEALGPDRRSKLLGALKKRVASDTTTRESENQTAAGEQRESDERLLFDEEYRETVETAAEKIGPDRAQGLVEETTEAMGLSEGEIPADRRAAFLKLLKAKTRSASRLAAEEQQQQQQQQPEQAAQEQAALEQQPRQPEPQPPPPQPELQQQPPQPAQPAQEIPFQPIEQDKAITPAGAEHAVEYAIVDADTLVASHDRFGNLNPAYPQTLQPRDRSRAASQLQIERLSRDLRPELLDRSPGAESGAPIIDPGGVVESGNARTIALQTAYAKGTAENYRQYLAGKGYPVEGVGKSVLVRIRRSELTPEQRLAFTREANQQAVMSLSRTERAFTDAEAMPPGLVNLYEGGAVDLAKNRDFVRSFVRDVVGPTEQTTFVSAKGELTADGVQRIEAALLAKAYSDRRLVERIAEAADPGRRTIRNVLVDVAPQWAAMRESVAAGRTHADIDQTKALLDAVNLIDRSERERVPVSDLVNQGSLFGEGDEVAGERVKAFLGRFFTDSRYKRLRAQAEITEALRGYLESAKRYDPRQMTLLGEPEAPPIERMLRRSEEPTPPTVTEPPTVAEPPTVGEPPTLTEPQEPPAEPTEPEPKKKPKPKSKKPKAKTAEEPSKREKPVERMADAGEKLEGKRSRKLKELTDSKAGETKAEAERILKLTSRAAVWEISLPADATPGASRYLELARNRVLPFSEALGSKGKRLIRGVRGAGSRNNLLAAVGEGQITVETLRQEAAGYISALEILQETTSGAMTVAQAAASLRRLFYGDAAEIGFSTPLTKFGEALSPYVRRGRVQLSHIAGTGPYHLPQRIADDTSAPAKAKPLRRPTFAFDPEKGPDREGMKDRRGGRDVTGEDLVKTFGFRGVEFGEWVTGAERQRHVNWAYDALHDLAETLGIRPRDISLGGTLGFAFGSRGRGRFTAHYEPTTKVINLTKTRGDGSFAHEWGHALEYFLLDTSEPQTRRSLLSVRRSLGERYSLDNALKKIDDLLLRRSWIGGRKKAGPLEAAKDYVDGRLWQRSGWGARSQTRFASQASRLGEYWQRPEELVARSFEAWVIDALQGRSQYLVSEWASEGYVSKQRGYKASAYPEGDERNEFADLWDGLFGALEWGEAGPVLKPDYRSPIRNTIDEITAALDGIDLEKRLRELQVGEPSPDGLWWYRFDGRRQPGNQPKDYAAYDDSGVKAEGGQFAQAGYGKALDPDVIKKFSLSPVVHEATDGTAYIKDEAKSDERLGIGSDQALDGISPAPGEVSEGDGRSPRRGRTGGTERRPDVRVTAQSGSGPVGGAARGEEVLHPAAGREGRAGTGLRSGPLRSTGTDYQITGGDRLGRGTPLEKIDANLKAIETLKKIQAEDRPATPQEQSELVRYSGWGGLKRIFQRGYDQKWQAAGKRLAELLTPEEYEQARASILNAHYTSPEVIRAIWSAAMRLGFNGGRVLEPAAGAGHFLGLLPEKLRGQTKAVAVEMDAISAGITGKLYGQAQVYHSPYQDVTLPPGFFDLAISNVPFLEVAPTDKVHNKARLLLHDYYFAKSIELVRPGGLVAFITSKGTMDKANTRARTLISKKADLAGAIRLPENTFEKFAGTTVTTDIVFLRRKIEGSEFDQAEPWIETEPASMPFSGNPEQSGEFPLNQYYRAHPEMLLGEMQARSGRYGDQWESALIGREEETLPDLLDRAVQALPANVMEEAGKEAEQERAAHSIPVEGEVKDGGITEKDGKLYQREGDSMTPLPERTGKEKSDAAKIRQYIGIRDTLRDLLRSQLEGGPKREVAAGRTRLNRLYDAYVTRYGTLRKTLEKTSYYQDPDAGAVLALEVWNARTEETTKAAVFERDTVAPREIPTSADSAEDALAISLNEKGRVDLDYMARLTVSPTDDLTAQLHGLIIDDPEQGWVTADAYLSGNVREKLKIAQAAARTDARYEANVSALKQVQPADLPPSQITATLGSPWIPPGDIRVFVSEMLSAPARDVVVNFEPLIGKWIVTRLTDLHETVAATDTWGTRRKHFFELLDHALNGGFPTVRDRVGDNKYVVNPAETAAAGEKLRRIKERFAAWAWEDPERARHLVRVYNDTMNAIRLRVYDGSHLGFPLMNSEFQERGGLRRHQRDAVWRVLQSGATYLGHEVGTGKTAILITAAMKARQLGLARKPMIAVPKPNLPAMAEEFQRLYPAANVLTVHIPSAGSRPLRRRRVVQQIALNDWDAVLVTHESFGAIGVSSAEMASVVREELEVMEAALVAAKGEGANRSTVRELEKARYRLRDKLKELKDRIAKTDAVTFEGTGIDMVLIDEAHNYKNLQFSTRLGRTVRGLSQSASGRSFEFYAKTRYLHRIGGKIVMASGTPLSNSVGELFTISRYLQPGELEKRDLQHFDSWAATFGDIDQVLEYLPEGGGYRSVTKFRKFRNVPELMQMIYSVLDVMTADKAGIRRPPIEGGKPEPVVMPQSAEQRVFQQELAERSKRIRENPMGALPDNMLVVSSDGRKGAVDMRLTGSGYGVNENGKIAELARRAAEIHRRTASFQGVQLVFLDLFGPTGANPSFNAQHEIKRLLTAQGIPAGEIVSLHDIDGASKTAKARVKRLFADVNAGRVRVLVASTKKGGTGVNVQERVAAIHHLDTDWNIAGYLQRNGRGHRQGNLVFDEYGQKLRILNYTVEGTVDAFMWDKVGGKARLFDRLLSGEMREREIEDISRGEVTASEMLALTSGDPLVAEREEVSRDLNRLALLRHQWQDRRFRLQSDLAQLPDRIKAKRTRAANLEADQKLVSAAETIKFETSQPGSRDATTYTFRLDEEGLAAAWQKLVAQEGPDDAGPLSAAITKVTGPRGSFDIRGAYENRKLQALHVTTPHGDSGHAAGARPAGMLKTAAERFTKDAARLRREADTLESKDLPETQEAIEKPFEQESEHETKKARLDEIDAVFHEREVEASQAQPPAPESAKAAPEPESRPAPEAMARERPLTAAEAARFEKLPEILGTVLKRLAPNTAFEAGNAVISGSRGFAQGRYRPYNSVIEVALDPGFGTSNPLKVLHHEAIHALKADGLFSEPEWNTLTREAREENWIGRYHIRERYPELFEGGEPSAAATEETIADAFADWSADPAGWKQLVARIFAKLRRLLRQLRAALLRDGWQTSAEDIFSRVASGEVGARTPATRERQGAVRESRPETKEARESRRRAEQRFKARQKGLRGSGPGLAERVKEGLTDFREGWVRTYRDLPRTSLFADAHEWLRSLKAAPSVASGEVVRHLSKLTEGLNAERLDLMTRKVFMDDFYGDVKQGMQVPFWAAAEEFMESYREVNAVLASDPDLASRVRRRQAYVRSVARRMVEAGVISAERLKRKNYIKHQVIEYAETELRAGRVRGVRKPKWARRMGTTLEINTNLLEAESDWLQRAQVDIKTAQVLTQFAESPQYNQRGELKQATRDHNKVLTDELVVKEFRAALGLIGIGGGLADAVKTPADIRKFLDDNSKDVDFTNLKTPIRNKLQAFRKRIGKGFGSLRASLDEADVPGHLRREYKLLMDTERAVEATEDSVFPLVVWAAQNLDGASSIAARGILKAVNERRQFLTDQLGDRYINSNNMERALKQLRRGGETRWEGFEAWQPDAGRLLFTAMTVPEHVIGRLSSNLGQVLEDGGMAGVFPAEEVQAAMEAMREQLVVGGPKFEMVLPAELAATLDSFGHEDSAQLAVLDMYLKTIRGWKIWTLVNPRRWFKYNAQNLSGDLDGVIAAFPKALKRKYLERALRETWDVMVKNGTPSATYQEAAQRGVFDGGWAISEVYDVQNDIEGLLERPSLGMRGLKGAWKFLTRSTTFRENLLRYAMYLGLREEIQTARRENPGRLTGDLMPLVGYGAGRIDQANAISSDADRAAYIARESLGDYGAISVHGQVLRKWMVPFWSWQEINTKRYMRLASNIYATKTGFGRASSLAALGARVGTRAALWLTWRAMVFTVGVNLWNTLLFDDLEEELRDEDRRRLHLIMGKWNGEIVMLRVPGALSDFMGWFGLDDVRAALSHISKGRGSWRDVAEAVIQAPINRLVNGVTPTIKVPGEALAGRSFFPDVFNPRLVRDSWRHVFRSLQVEPAYDYLLGRPSPGAGRILATTFVDARHTGYSAYSKIRGEAYQWLRAVEGADGAPLYASQRGNAYFYYRMALKFNDTEAAARYRTELRRLGVTGDLMRAMIKRAHPLGMLTSRERRAFLRTLTPEEKRSLDRAIAWWRETYVGGHKLTQRD